MAQHDYVIDNSTGANVRADINNALLAISSTNSGSSAPSTTYAFQLFANTTTSKLQIRNAANSAFVDLIGLDGTILLADGSVSSPSLAFSDDLNTGIFSSAADTLNFSTGGVERMELGATTIFNESGADVDFRIEGDTNANLFYVDAGNNRIGIGSATPRTTLDVTGNIFASNGGQIQITGSSGSKGLQLIGQDDGTSLIGTMGSSGEHLLFRTASTERMRIDTSGRVLIGTTTEGHSSADELTIAGTGQTGMTIRSGTSNDAAIFFADGTSGDAEYRGFVQYNHTNDRLNFGTSGLSRATLDSTGKLGLGTEIPSDKLEIRAGGIYLHSESQASSGALSARLRFLKFHTTTTAAEYEVARIESFTQNGFAGGLDFYFGKLVGSGNYAITQGLRLDHEGTLQIANAAAIAGFTSSAVANSVAPLKIYKSSSTTHAGLQLIWDHFNTTTGISQKIQFTIGDDAGADGFNNAGFIGIEKVDSWQSGSGRDSSLIFGTTQNATESEKMRLSSQGTLSIGTTNNSVASNNVQGISLDGTNGYLAANRTNTESFGFGRGGTGLLGRFFTDGTAVGQISVGSSSTTYSTTSSDRALKKNFEVWNEDVLSIFKNLNPQKFNFIKEDDSVQKTKGYIAQDLVEHFPEAYPKDETTNKYWFNPSGMVVYLMKAIQELEAKVAALEAA